MQLEQLLLHISYECVQGSLQREITDICYHSQKAAAGSLFVCLRGFRTEGFLYVPEAVARGASAVVVECGTWTESRMDVTVIMVQDSRRALAELSAAFFDFPARKLKLVGITGTKGKTTTAYLAAQILREAGHRVGLIGTIAVEDGAAVIPAENTTPESYEIHRYLAHMVENGCDCCIMEVSSQGLKMQRVAGICYDVGIFLNIVPDHIGAGEHASFAEYLACKRMLLQQCVLGLVNADDAHCGEILEGHTCKVRFFSMKKQADYMAEQASFAMSSGRLLGLFLLKTADMQTPVVMQLPGLFNVSNALAASAAADYFGVDAKTLCRGLLHAQVPGRCENVSTSKEYVLLIDYAHNAMSLRNLLQMLRTFKPKRLIVLFGCGGNRSKLRRDKMGETAGQLADLTILTSDNPRWEKPEEILDDIERGILRTKGAYVRITDRREAVRYAIRCAGAGDIIVLAGKGHEEYQEICGVKYPMCDAQLVREAAAESDNDDGIEISEK